MPSEFSITHRVQFGETDLAGIVHFSNFFRMMEEVEHAFFRSLGLSVVMRHDGLEIGWPRVSVACEYSGSARFEDELELKFRITRLGDKSMTFEVDFLLKEQRIATGKVTTVCCVLENGGMRSIAIPAGIRAKLQ
jgi:YbgC/YbaW family acyl-CoA thioester hydrolase